MLPSGCSPTILILAISLCHLFATSLPPLPLPGFFLSASTGAEWRGRSICASLVFSVAFTSRDASPCCSSKTLLQSHLARPCCSPQSSRAMGCLLHSFTSCFLVLCFGLVFFMVLFEGLVPSCHTSKQIKKKFPSRCTCTLLFYRGIHQSFSSERILSRGTVSYGASISFPFVFQGNKCPLCLRSTVDPHPAQAALAEQNGTSCQGLGPC